MKLRKSSGVFELLEQRTMMSVGASAQLNLIDTAGTPQTPIYHYDITLTNTGTTKVGTFWFGWIPGHNFLPTAPSSATSPSGWGNANGASATPAFTGEGGAGDGTGIQWVAQSTGALLSTGASLSGFDFTTTDSPAALSGNSAQSATDPILTSFVYVGAPFSDSGFKFVAADASTTQLATSQISIAPSGTTINAGENLKIDALVGSATPGGAAPTGTVEFFSNGTSLGTIAVASDGLATLNTAALSAGSDSITATYSGDATYAASTSAPTTITVNAGALLQPSIGKSTLPTSAVVSTPVHGNVVVSLTNVSGAKTTSTATVDVYASATGAIDGTAMLIGTAKAKVKLAAGASQNATVKIKSLPASLIAGSYMLVARATDASNATADSPAGPALVLGPATITLAASFTKTTFPKTILTGGKNKASAILTIANSGNVSTTGKATITLGVSTDGVNTTSTFPATLKPAVIKPGKNKPIKLAFAIDPTLPAGTYFLTASISLDDQSTATISTTTFTIS